MCPRVGLLFHLLWPLPLPLLLPPHCISQTVLQLFWGTFLHCCLGWELHFCSFTVVHCCCILNAGLLVKKNGNKCLPCLSHSSALLLIGGGALLFSSSGTFLLGDSGALLFIDCLAFLLINSAAFPLLDCIALLSGCSWTLILKAGANNNKILGKILQYLAPKIQDWYWSWYLSRHSMSNLIRE